MSSTTNTMPLPETTEAFVAKHARRNFWLNVIEGGLFMLGMHMMSSLTVLPYIVQQYSDEKWVQGLIPAIANTGWLLPGLFMAPLIAHLWRRKPLIMTLTFFERIPWLILGVWLFSGNTFDSATTLVYFFSLYAIFMFSAGFNGVPWNDFISRIIPPRQWGTFFGVQFGVGSLLGIAGAAIATQVLANQPLVIGTYTLIPAYTFPYNIGLLSLICFTLMAVAYIFLAFSVEPAIPPQPKQPFWALIRDMPALLRDDTAFLRYIIAYACISVGMIGHSFVTASALVQFKIDGSTVGLFTVVLMVAQTIGNIGLGTLADRWGRRRVIILGSTFGLLILLLPWFARDASWYYPMFALGGIAMGGNMPANSALVFSFASVEKRASYIAVSNVFNAPLLLLASLTAGGIAELYGFKVLFIGLVVIGFAGIALLKWGVANNR